MKTKTCGECRKFGNKRSVICHLLKADHEACASFEPPPTNGDRIRQMSNERLAGFISSRVECLGGALGLADCPGDQMNCVKCWEIWLNAPTDDCVKQNGNHETQPGLCVADNTESEVSDE